MAKTRTFRIAGATLLFGAVAWTMAPHALNRVSSSAVVNAPLTRVIAPIDGALTHQTPATGSRITPGDLLAAVEAKAPDHRRLVDLETRADELTANLDALRRQDRRLAEKAERLAARAATYAASSRQRLDAEIAEREAELAGARAQLAAARKGAERTGALVGKGYVPQTRHEANQAAASLAQARIGQIQAVLERLRIERAAATKGSYVRDGHNDVPYSRQRLDEIELRRADLAAEIDRVSNQRDSLARRIENERREIGSANTFHAHAAEQAVIWRASPDAGASIAQGELLVETVSCEKRFLEVHISERHFENVRPGDVAQVKLRGASSALEAPVTAVRGAGAHSQHPDLAASIREPEAGQLQVMIDLEGIGLSRDAGVFCHVGRTAEVRFARPAPVDISAGANRIARLMGDLGSRIDSAWQETLPLVRSATSGN